MAPRWIKILVALLLVGAASEFVVRGPMRLLRGMGWNDFLSPYIQATVWIHGGDPYSPQSLVVFWPADNLRPSFVDVEAASGLLEKKRGIPSPYPLPSLVLISPLTALPWRLAVLLWMGLSVASVLLAVLVLLYLSGCRLGELRAQLFIAAVLALAPLHTGLSTANPVMLVMGLSAVAHWAARSDKEKLAGVLLALAVCLKPTVAGGLLFYYLVTRRWRVVAITCFVIALVTGIGISRLALSGAPWLSSYVENTRHIFALGSVDDFTRAASLRFDMINAHVLFGSVASPAAAAFFSRTLGITFLACWLWVYFRGDRHDEVLEISAVFVLSLIGMYHRFYDAVLLIWVLAWSLLLVRTRYVTFLSLVAIVPFFVPGQAYLSGLSRSGRLPSVVTTSWWWNGIVLSHEVWLLILLEALLLFFMSRQRSNSAAPALQHI